MLVANLPETFQVSLRGHQDARRTGYRFDNHGCNRRCIVQLDKIDQVFGPLASVFGNAACEGVFLKIVGVTDMVDAGQQRSEHFSVRQNTANGNTAEIDTVITARSPDKTCAAAFSSGPLIRQRDLQRRFYAFRSGIGEEEVGPADWGPALRGARRVRRPLGCPIWNAGA